MDDVQNSYSYTNVLLSYTELFSAAYTKITNQFLFLSLTAQRGEVNNP
jgi:hypothetical protein